jgi:hypothetical protein
MIEGVQGVDGVRREEGFDRVVSGEPEEDSEQDQQQAG